MSEVLEQESAATTEDGPRMLVVTDVQVQAAMSHFERANGRGDGISISKEVSKLADLLGAMWYARESEAQVPSSSKIGQLLLQAGVAQA